MLNPFPIQFLAPLAYALLRFCVGLLFIRLGIRCVKHRLPTSTLDITKISPLSPIIFLLLGILEMSVGILFILGFQTQIVALITLVVASMHIFSQKRLMQEKTPPRIFFVLLFFTALSLFITGAGAFAFDLPI